MKPNTGFVAPGATQIVHVIMQAQRDWPSDIAGCKDKFLVQSVPSGASTDFTELFAKGREDIKETKLRVSYTQPAPPPSPINEGEEDRTEDARGSDSSRMEPSDVSSLQREIERYRIKNESLSADLDASLRVKETTARGFSLLHLIITGTRETGLGFRGSFLRTSSKCFAPGRLGSGLSSEKKNAFSPLRPSPRARFSNLSESALPRRARAHPLALEKALNTLPPLLAAIVAFLIGRYL